MGNIHKRLSLVEYGSPIDLSREIATALGVDRTKANNLLTDAGSRAALSLGLSYNPISVDARGARAIDFAGLLRLTPSLELEVAPKFLGLDDADAAWREDFFFLSTLSRHGRLLATERLSSSGGYSRDLSTLVARAITSMYEAQKRRPLRSYRRVMETDFCIDGDPDLVDLVLPPPDGFEQEVIRFDRRNSWNADIVAAAKELLPEISDPSVVGSLMRLINELTPQSYPSRRRRTLPSRHRAWKPLHELAVDTLGGFGLSYKQGQVHAPGYLVSTWRVWEDLLTVAARLGFGHSAVVSQKGFRLGTKFKVNTETEKHLLVFPDCMIKFPGVRSDILLDAKYKGHVEKGKLRITESDIYEAIAFSRASNCNLVVLAYPAQPGDKQEPVGTCMMFEKIQVEELLIIGIQIEIRLISKSGALQTFAANLANWISFHAH